MVDVMRGNFSFSLIAKAAIIARMKTKPMMETISSDFMELSS
jgi:hypothetical protein